MKSSIGEILKEQRIKANISVKQISELLVSEGFKASEKTIYSWESGNSQPTPDALLAMCKAYGITDILNTFSDAETEYDTPSKKEWEFIKKYRLLDQSGIKTVNYILDSEIKRVEAYSELMAQLRQASAPATTVPIRMIQYYQRLASAGSGQIVFDGVPVEQIEIPDRPEYRRVSYAVGVNGHSMEPLYEDGDILLIEPTCQVEQGEVGIFIVGNNAFVKKLGETELISVNKDYKNIPLTEDTKCMGRVVDKLSLQQ